MDQSRPEFLLQWNTNHMVSHWGEFKNYILHNKPLVAAVQETRFLDSDSLNYNFNIYNYSLFTNNVNSNPRRGGSALYISHNLLHHQIPLQTTLNVVGAKVKIAQRDLTILSIYLSPNLPFHPHQLTELISQITPPFIIMGDFNAHNQVWGCRYNDTRGTQLLNVINSLDLIPITNMIPTHTCTHNGEVTHSVIDFAITDTNTATLFTQYTADDPLFSDHYPLHYSIDIPSGQCNFSFLPRWNFNKANWVEFQKHINVSLTTSPPQDINTFLDTILEAANKHVPMTRPHRKHNNTPWWNNECQRAVALRRRALRTFRRCPCQAHEEEARKTRLESHKIILREKTSSWQTFSNNFNRFTPLSKIWTYIKCFNRTKQRSFKIPHLQINNTHYLVPLDVATQFALHYTNISSSQQYTHSLTTSLDNQLTHLSFHSNNTEKYNSLFSEHELQIALAKCGNTSVGPDQVAYQFLKNLPASGLETLLATINSLWESNSYPPSWRESIVIPILKPSKPPSDPANYRPISLTSCASKLMERMINGRIRAYLESNELLTHYQNGFRPGRSTSDSLAYLIDSIQKGFQFDDYTIAVFLDFKNAFDKVHKSAILIKLHSMGLRGRTAHFIQGFLSNRTIRVRCGNTYSPSFTQDHGLPQGSVISPTLFLIMINDILTNSSQHIKYSLYADDVALWCTHNNLIEGIKLIQHTLQHIENWCTKWGLVLSPSKSVAMIFAPKEPNFHHPNLHINNAPLKYVKNYKYLGITLDTTLNFSKHFEDIKQRCTRRLNILKCIAGREWGADRRTLSRLYTSLIRPILDYNGFLYDDIAGRGIDSLQIIQNAAIRIILGAMRTSNIDTLHIEADLPTLDRRRKYLLLRYFIRSSARPKGLSHQILTTQHQTETPSARERRFPLISFRLQKLINHFQINIPPILPIPPLTSMWLDPVPNIDFLFTSNKKITSLQEIAQLFLEYQDKHRNHFFFFTDGSVADGKTGAGVFSQTYQNASRLHDIYSIYSAELSAILHAINYIRKKNIIHAIICTDSLSSLMAISNRKQVDHHIVYLIKKNLIKLHRRGFHIRILWVPGHSGIKGNDQADQLAKDSLALPARNHIRCTHQDVASLVQSALTKLRQFDWDTFPHYHAHPIHPKIGLFKSANQNTRLKETVIARLRIGHCILTHAHLYHNEPPPTCPHCTPPTKLTIAHFLFHCTQFDLPRQHIIHYTNTHNIPLDLPTLLGDNHPELLDILFEFLKESNLLHRI